MTKTLIRGRVLSFLSEPRGVDDDSAYLYIEDGAVLIEDGKIIAVDEYSVIEASTAEIIDHRPYLVLPGLIDAHVHFPQMQVIASWGTQLLDWLETYTFPIESKFADYDHSLRFAGHFFDELLHHGTTTAACYCTVHKTSVDAFFTEAARRNLRMIAGKILMDRNAPPSLCDTPKSAYDESKALIAEWHGKGRALYAITPRFAITSTPEQMEVVQTLIEDHSDCYIQTHLSENLDEIRFAAELYPTARDYLDIYERYGLLGSRSLFGHAIHLKEREYRALGESGSVAVFCPTSNLFLGSGLYDEERLRAHGVRTAIATDIGGGTSYSMLRTLDEGYKILQLQGQKLDPMRSIYWATLGNAHALTLESYIGKIAPGMEADLIILNSHATSAMALRMETVRTLAEELFVLQVLGDDRSVVQTYIAGMPVKSS